MRVEQSKPESVFMPVVITLENQDEVDRMVRVLAHAHQSGFAIQNWRISLAPFASKDA